MTMSKRGAKLKLTEKLQREICIIIANGHTARDACLIADISEGTYYSWIDQGRKAQDALDDGEDIGSKYVYVEFLEAIKKANAQFKETCMKHLRNDEGWQSKAWLLERRFPDEFARKDRLAIGGDESGEPIKFVVEWPKDEG